MGPEVWALCMQQQQQQATGEELKRRIISSYSTTLWSKTSTCRPMAAPLALCVHLHQQQQAKRELKRCHPNMYALLAPSACYAQVLPLVQLLQVTGKTCSLVPR